MREAPARLPSPSDEGLSLVIASPSAGECRLLRNICNCWNWKLYEAHCCQDALSLVRKHHSRVVVCEPTLPDGDWRTILRALAALPQQPRLIVASRLVDHYLWAEVLSLGGYDVLITPFDATEVFRVVSLAWHSANRLAKCESTATASAA